MSVAELFPRLLRGLEGDHGSNDSTNSTNWFPTYFLHGSVWSFTTLWVFRYAEQEKPINFGETDSNASCWRNGKNTCACGRYNEGRPGLVVTRGKLSQWLYWKKNFLKRSTGHIPDVSVNANSFCSQYSVMASAVLTRDRVLHYLPRQVKFYFLSFHVIDIKRLFQCNKLLYYLEKCPFTEYVG